MSNLYPFMRVFNEVKKQPVLDVSDLIDAVISSGKDSKNPLSWDWGTMRAIVAEDTAILTAFVTVELQMIYQYHKNQLLEDPSTIANLVVALHHNYGYYSSLVDVVAIQKEIFGKELFYKIEDAMVDYLRSDCKQKCQDTQFKPKETSDLEFAQHLLEEYQGKYRTYYFWPFIKGAFDEVIYDLKKKQLP